MARRRVNRRNLAILLVVVVAFAAIGIAIALNLTNVEEVKKRHLAQSDRLKEEGKLGEAIIECANALKQDQSDTDVRIKLGRLYLAANERRKAYNELRRAASQRPRSMTYDPDGSGS